MQKRNKSEDQKNHSKEKPQAPNQDQDEKVSKALEQAEADMEQDPDLSKKPDPADDLDEGALARVEGLS